MSKPMRELNPKLKPGDRVMLIAMEGENSVLPMYKGTVKSINPDPFEDSEIIGVDWDNGSNLSLLSSHDTWVKIEDNPEQIKESQEWEFVKSNPEVIKFFDTTFLNNYLKTLRKSSVVNMMELGPFLYSGREWIDRYYGEGQEDNESFQQVLEMADEARDKMIQGVMKYMKSKGMEIEIDKVNHLIKKFTDKIKWFYISFF